MTADEFASQYQACPYGYGGGVASPSLWRDLYDGYAFDGKGYGMGADPCLGGAGTGTSDGCGGGYGIAKDQKW